MNLLTTLQRNIACIGLIYITVLAHGQVTVDIEVDHQNESEIIVGREIFSSVNTSVLKTANSTLAFSDQSPTGGWQFPNAFQGITFTQPTCIETVPGNNNSVFVTERSGDIYVIPDVTSSSPVKNLFLDISNVRTQTFCGLRGLAFHPDFENNRYFYVGYDSNDDFGGMTSSIRVSRFTANENNLGTVDPSTEVVLFQAGTNQRIHRINRMLFGPDGYLYIAVGDDGNFTGPANSQRIDDDFWSSVLRIDVDKKPGNFEPINKDGVTLDSAGLAHYSIPEDNPYIDTNFNDGRGVTTLNGQTIPTNDATEVRTEMYAIGFRNPWKIGFVPNTGELWVADAGATGYEKYSIMPKGGNGGWGYVEGTDPGPLQIGTTQYPGPLEDPPASASFIQPVIEYKVPGSTSGTGVKSIVGGAFYEGSDIPLLIGSYLFCDFTKGDIWYMKRPDHGAFQTVSRVAVNSGWGLDETGLVTETISTNSSFEAKSFGVSEIVRIGSERDIVAMHTDPSDGSMLMLDYGDGVIRRLNFNPDDGSLPQTLSATGAFSDLANLTPNSGVHPYDINLTFWSDHADKKRFFAVKNLEDTITYSRDGFWEAPAEAVWVKHFDMDLNRDVPGTNIKRLETRFLVKTENDFYGVSYRWNDAGTEANLVATSGEEFDLTITEGGSTHTQTWRIPSRGDCRSCHTNDNGVILGFNTRQLNRFGTLSGTSGNYLKLITDAGYLSSSTESLPGDVTNLPKYSTPDDQAVNIEERVRSYLAVNCSYCHYEGTTGISVGDAWSGDHFLSIEETNLLHGEGIGFAVADPTDRYIIPGDSIKSMVLSLMSESNGYGRMPPLATDIVDQEGITLLTDWINNYANAVPTIDVVSGPFTVVENTIVPTVVGAIQASDLDNPDVNRGVLTYAIVGGNDEGYFGINQHTGEIFVANSGLDFESITSVTLSILISDGFAPNIGEITINVTVNISDIVGDDSQGDGIIDEWAIENFGISMINPLGDTDNDGFIELFEFWADTDPLDPTSLGLMNSLNGADLPEGSYEFEWTVRADLQIGTDYVVQGSNDFSFANLHLGTDFSIVSLTPVANGNGPALVRVRISVPTTSHNYFIRLSNMIQ